MVFVVLRTAARRAGRPRLGGALAVALAAALLAARGTCWDAARGATALARRAVHARWVDAERAWAVAVHAAGYRRLDAGLVTVYFPAGKEGEAQVVARLARQYLPLVARSLSAPPRPVTVVLVPSRRVLGQVIGPRYGLNSLGAYWRGVVWVLSPSEWLDTAAPGWEQRFEAEGPVVHELAHRALALQTGGNLPAWWDEGVAQHVEYRLTGFEWVEAGEHLDGRMYPLARLMDRFPDLDDEALAYREAALFVRFLAATRGEGAIARIDERLAAGWPLAAALEAECGSPPPVLETAWRAWLAAGGFTGA